MATLHVWHAAGSTGAPYATWATAAVNLTIAAAAAGANDTIYVAHDHVETSASTVTIAIAASGVKIICGTRTGTSTETGISALATTADVGTSSVSLLITTGSLSYYYGIIFRATNSGASTIRLTYDSAILRRYENCSFIIDGTNSSSNIRAGWDTNLQQCHTVVKNCIFEFSNASQSLSVDGLVEVIGGSISGSSAAQTYFCRSSITGRGGLLYLNGFDATNGGTGMALFGFGGTTNYNEARNCKLPTSGVPVSGTATGMNKAVLINCDTGDTNYKYSYTDVYGTVNDNTTVYRTAGAADEARGYSLAMASTTSAVWPISALRSPPIIQRAEAIVGGTVTVTVHICHYGASALTNQECWLEVETLANTGYTLSTIVNDTTTAIASSSAQPTSSEAWTGDSDTGPNGSSTWNQLKLECAGVTLAETGYVIARVHLGKASTTVYIDPKLEIVED